jgi:hypothetical protein
MMRAKVPDLMTLSRAHFVYIALFCLVVLPALAIIVLSPVLMVLWCARFELPEYERRFEFRMETFHVPGERGGTFEMRGIGYVRPGGPLSVAGVRPGDIPREHHGIEFCGALAAASEGRTAHIDVVNVEDLKAGQYNRREITLRGTR